MTPSLFRRLDALARQLSPFALTLGFVLFNVIPLRLPGMDGVAPSLPLISVFYWSLYRPDLMPAAAVFLIGLLEDTLTGGALGVFAGTFVSVHAAVHAQRRFFLGKPFAIVWLGFALIACGAFALAWLVTSAFFGVIIDAAAVVTRSAITIGCFPAVAWLLLRCHRSLLRSL